MLKAGLLTRSVFCLAFPTRISGSVALVYQKTPTLVLRNRAYSCGNSLRFSRNSHFNPSHPMGMVRNLKRGKFISIFRVRENIHLFILTEKNSGD